MAIFATALIYFNDSYEGREIENECQHKTIIVPNAHALSHTQYSTDRYPENENETFIRSIVYGHFLSTLSPIWFIAEYGKQQAISLLG